MKVIIICLAIIVVPIIIKAIWVGIAFPFFRICNAEVVKVSICNAKKQRYAAAVDLFRIPLQLACFGYNSAP